ncbi:hypothetical protein AS132_10730 [Photobacterium sanguinicancri]|nr:hypothetical protein AS132_10730 [Photobacterium sanguinicancri]
MFRSYAIFSYNHPWVHRFILLFIFMITIASVYMTLVEENILFLPLLLVPLLMTVLFGKASDYKRKFLHNGK